jgi:hypothetical protein
MNAAPDTAPRTIAGHAFAVQERAADTLNLRIALGGAPLIALARALARLDGVRVTSGPERADGQPYYLVHCQGFKVVLSAPGGESTDFAFALVSRTPQAALAVMSDLGSVLERLMSEVPREEPPAITTTSSPLRRSSFQQGKPLARKTQLRRKTPLSRGPFRKR